MQRRVLALAVFLGIATATPVSATILYNDTWVDGSQVAIQLGNCGGECDAVVLTPPSYPFDVNYVYSVASGAGGGGASLVADVWITGVDGNDEPDLDNILGGLEAMNANVSGGQWFEVSLGLGTPATIESGSFAVAFCFYSEEPFEPCNYVGLGTDLGPMALGGGHIYANSGMMCSGFQECTEIFPGSYSWYTNVQLGLNRNWIIRASDEPWTPEMGDDDDDATSDDDDATSTDDDDDDTTGSGDVKVDSIEPASIDAGDTTRFVVTGTGFQDDLDLFFGNIRVSQVDVESAVEIEGIFPAELVAGMIDVCVENPDGGSDCMLQGLEVEAVEGETPAPEGCDCDVTGERAWPVAALSLALALGLLRYRRRR